MRTNVEFKRDKFIVNKEKKTVTCILKVDMNLYVTNRAPKIIMDLDYWKKQYPEVSWDGRFEVVGIAKCAEEDIFDEVKGRRIAESRAKKEGFRIAKEVYKLIYFKNMDELDKLRSLIIGCMDAVRTEQYHINELEK